MGHIGHMGKMSVSGYRDVGFNHPLLQYVVSLSKTLSALRQSTQYQ